MPTRHPYRSESLEPAPDPKLGLEERIVGWVLLVDGAIGLAVGFAAPRAHGTELVLGAFLFLLGARTARRRRVAPVV